MKRQPNAVIPQCVYVFQSHHARAVTFSGVSVNNAVKREPSVVGQTRLMEWRVVFRGCVGWERGLLVLIV